MSVGLAFANKPPNAGAPVALPKDVAAEAGVEAKGFASALGNNGIGFFPNDKGGMEFEVGACVVSVGKEAKGVSVGCCVGSVNCLTAGSSRCVAALVLTPGGAELSRTSLKSACEVHERV